MNITPQGGASLPIKGTVPLIGTNFSQENKTPPRIAPERDLLIYKDFAVLTQPITTLNVTGSPHTEPRAFTVYSVLPEPLNL